MINKNQIILGKCEDHWSEIEKLKIDLILTDPPYNIGFDYGVEYPDKLTGNDYQTLLSTFKGKVPLAICLYPEESIEHLGAIFGKPDKVLAWCYHSNINRMFRLISIYNKKPDMSKVKQPYKNLKDKRIQRQIQKQAGNKEIGANLYDWFSDIQLVKNVSEEKTEHPCPVPVKLFSRIITLLTEPGDTVYDPFMGSGTTAIACLETGRQYVGTEMSEKYFNICQKRIKEWKAVQSGKIW